MSISMILSTMYDDVCILHVWHFFLPILSPSQLVEASQEVGHQLPRRYLSSKPESSPDTSGPCQTLHKDPPASPIPFPLNPPPFPALQQLMPELPGRCGTWTFREKNSPNEYPVFSQVHQLVFSTNIAGWVTPFCPAHQHPGLKRPGAFQSVDGERLVAQKHCFQPFGGPTLPQR